MALLPQDPRKQQTLLVGIVPLLLFFAWYQFVRPARLVEIETLEGRVERVAAANQTARARMAVAGIPACSASSGSWTSASPPAALMARRPEVPSPPVPEQMIPAQCSPQI